MVEEWRNQLGENCTHHLHGLSTAWSGLLKGLFMSTVFTDSSFSTCRFSETCYVKKGLLDILPHQLLLGKHQPCQSLTSQEVVRKITVPFHFQLRVYCTRNLEYQSNHLMIYSLFLILVYYFRAYPWVIILLIEFAEPTSTYINHQLPGDWPTSPQQKNAFMTCPSEGELSAFATFTDIHKAFLQVW